MAVLEQEVFSVGDVVRHIDTKQEGIVYSCPMGLGNVALLLLPNYMPETFSVHNLEKAGYLEIVRYDSLQLD